MAPVNGFRHWWLASRKDHRSLPPLTLRSSQPLISAVKPKPNSWRTGWSKRCLTMDLGMMTSIKREPSAPLISRTTACTRQALFAPSITRQHNKTLLQSSSTLNHHLQSQAKHRTKKKNTEDNTIIWYFIILFIDTKHNKSDWVERSSLISWEREREIREISLS